MELASLETWNFRNLANHTLSWGPGLNLVVGGNGHGKTNLLEAIAVLGNVRSFRGARPRRLVRHGEGAFRLSGTVRTGAGEVVLQQVVEVTPEPRRTLTINRAEVDLATYLSTFPVFVLAPGDRDLVVAGPDVRRAYVDRVAFLLHRDHLTTLRHYGRSLKQRNAALVAGAGGIELEGWERQLAHHGARLVAQRLAAVDTLAAAFAAIHRELVHPSSPEITLSYRAEVEEGPSEKLEQVYRQRYNENRARDRGAGFTFDGPHRHDLTLRADGRAVKDVLSSGQAKIVAAALRLASLSVVEQDRESGLPLLIDDVDAELDAEAVERLMSWVGDRRQTSLSSVNEDLGDLRSQGNVIRMSDGCGHALTRPGGSP